MKIAIVGKIHEIGLETLNNLGCSVKEVHQTETISLIESLSDVDGIILRTAKIHNEVIDNCPNLKIIARHGVGFDNVDLNYLNLKGIALGITGTSNAVSVAEHVLTFFLQLTKNINISDKLTRNGNFNEKSKLPNFYELYEKNILICGFGRIGQAVAKRCLGFETNVFVYDPFVDEKLIMDKGCQPISKDKGLQIADYITIHLPLNEHTKNFISASEFKNLKNNCILVNTSRGGIINEKDLYEALREKLILGAGLDVFEEEPPQKNNQLFQLENILLTPHSAALSLECRIRMAKEACETAVFYLKNHKSLNLDNIVNRKNLSL